MSLQFHTQLEHTILKCVTGQHLLFSKTTIFFIIFFTAHAYFKPELLMVPYAFRILQHYIEFH